MIQRAFRPKQKGVNCSVEGCKKWCVSNDLCSKHNMALRRYGSTQGKPGIKKICKTCNKEFINKYEITGYCSIQCYHKTPEQRKKNYEAVKRYRSKYPQKSRASDIVNKRIKRGISLHRQPCSICGKPKAEAHHYDYDKPLEITWLCKQHHEEVHHCM